MTTDNYDFELMPTSPVEWVAIINSYLNKVEAGRTMKITAAENITEFEPITIPNVSGKVSRATNVDSFYGLAKATMLQDATGFAYCGVGNEITNAGWSWTVGALIYVSTVAGTLTETQPSPLTKPIAFANSTTSIVLGRPLVNTGNPLVYNFMQSDVSAGQAAVALDILGLSGNTEYTMIKAGSIIGISIAANAARSAGTLTIDVTKNGTVTGLQAVLDGSNTQYHYAAQAVGADAFVAGDRIGIKITTDGAWAPTTDDIVASAIVEI